MEDALHIEMDSTQALLVCFQRFWKRLFICFSNVDHDIIQQTPFS
jgi:hypothetical protein